MSGHPPFAGGVQRPHPQWGWIDTVGGLGRGGGMGWDRSEVWLGGSDPSGVALIPTPGVDEVVGSLVPGLGSSSLSESDLGVLKEISGGAWASSLKCGFQTMRTL